MNDLLIPEITVQRGKTYTFLVEGGDQVSQPARYHPFYITNSPEGGFGQKSDAEKLKQTVYAGVDYDEEQYAIPTAGKYFIFIVKIIRVVFFFIKRLTKPIGYKTNMVM